MKPTTKIIIAATVMAITGLSSVAQAATEINWWHAHSGKLGEVVAELTERFNASQSEYNLISTYKGGYEDTMTAGIAAFRAKKQPNILQVYDAGAATIINAKGATIAVADLMEKYSSGFKSENFIQGVRYFYADSNDKMIGLPFNASTPLLYYNKDAFKKAGVSAPPKTWEEFEKLAPKFKAAGYQALANSHRSWIFAENFHSRHNLQLATANNGYDSTDVKIKYNNKAMIHHWTKVKSWLDKGWFGFYGNGWGDNQDAFQQQKVAMWLGSSGSFGGLRKSAKFEFGAAYLPYWKSIIDKPKGTFIGGAALWALSGKPEAENKGVAKFFEFMTKTETQLYWHKETGYVPITSKAYQAAKDEGYYKEVPQAEFGILQLNQTSGKWSKGYRLGFYPQIREVMNKHFDKIFNGSSSVEDALADIEKEANALLVRFNDTYN
jgi:sn-glycerol 3-phosphate transport system substrate-binding protein